MMQGDSYNFRVEIINSLGAAITPSDVSDIEITIGRVEKTYKKNEITFDKDTNKWIYHLSQKETFKFPARSFVKRQMRIVWLNGDVKGIELGDEYVNESESKVVL